MNLLMAKFGHFYLLGPGNPVKDQLFGEEEREGGREGEKGQGQQDLEEPLRVILKHFCSSVRLRQAERILSSSKKDI